MPASASSSKEPTPRLRLLRALDRLAEQTPRHRVSELCVRLMEFDRPTAAVRALLREANTSTSYGTLVDRVCDRWQDVGCHGQVVSLAFEGASEFRDHTRELVEIVWTGPAADLVTARQTSAVLFGAIEAAKTSITICGFAAYTVPGLVDLLVAAVARDVKLHFILETVHDSGGGLSLDGSMSLQRLKGLADFYVWPLALRPSQAKMHAKFILVDTTMAFVTSANLTDHGVDRNLELGLAVFGGDVPRRLHAHVETLIASKTFVIAT